VPVGRRGIAERGDRVVSPPGKQAQIGRLSFAYMVKPSGGASMKRLVGREGGSKDWDGQCSFQEWLLMKSRATSEGKNVVRIGEVMS
jgi:hypothetical protein